MSQRTFLVTGATGDTGGATAEQMLARGHQVRALAHRQDDRAERLQGLGAEVVFGDFLNLDDVRAALLGVAGAYFCYPIRPGIIQATALFAQAAKEAGVKCVVNMSQISAREDAKSHAAQDHWLMLQRNLLYTGVTRGKKLVVLVGQKKAVAIAVRSISGRRRWSKLREWLAEPKG